MRRLTSGWPSLAAPVALLLVLLFLLVPGGTSPAFASNDPLSSEQWALSKIRSEASWGRSTGKDVVVAVVDTGVNFAHEDLQGSSAGSFTCIGQCTEGGDDDNGHGTWVAGIIAARANNGKGIAGVAPDAKILSVKSLNKDGQGDISDVAMGIKFAAEHGAKVINLSLGSDLPLPVVLNLVDSLLGAGNPFQQAVNDATQHGSLVIAAAGNSGLASGFVGLQNLLLVGASGPNDEVAAYSSSLLGVTLHAPGGNAPRGQCTPADCVVTTDRGGGYKAVQGTSFAAPHVSGVVAQLLARGYSPVGAAARLLTSADLSNGVRRLNADAAVQGDPLTASTLGAADPGLGSVHLPTLDALGRLLPLGTRSGGRGAAVAAPAAADPVTALPAPAAPPAATGPSPNGLVPSEGAGGPLLPGIRRELLPVLDATAPSGTGAALATPVPLPDRRPLTPLAGIGALYLVLGAAIARSCHRLMRKTAA